MATYTSIIANNAYLAAPSSNAYQFGTGDFTIESWIRTATSGGTGAIVSRKGSSGGAGNGGFLVVIRADGSLKFATDDGFGFFEIDTAVTTVNNGAWHHVAAVRRGASLTIYLDGLSVSANSRGSGTPPLNINNSLPLTIGATQQQQEQYAHFSGEMDAVAIWNTARNATQVVNDLHTVLSGNESGLVGYWTFDNQNGNDSSPYHNNAVPNGTITYTSPGAPITGADIALRLASGGSLSAVSNNAYQFGSGDFSVEAWLRTAAAGGSGTIVARKGSAGGQSGDGGFLLVLKADSTLKFATDNGFGYFEVDSNPTNANNSLWHHVAAVRKGAGLYLYLDGQALTTHPSGNATPPLNITNSLPLTIGMTQQQQEPYNQFIGDLGMVTLWNAARSAAQVASDMRTLLAGNESSLVGYWTFGYSNGLDISPTYNTATASGAASYVTPGAPWQYYAAVLVSQGSLQASANNAYLFGTQDFTLEAWVLCSAQSGTVIARKGIAGGQAGDGGFLLVINADGSVKFATDNGFGYFQMVTQPIGANNGWHFLAAVRRGAALEIYLDAGVVSVQSSGNATPPLDVNNSLPLTIGMTQQQQEPYRFFSGQLDAVTVWNIARSPQQIAMDMSTRLQGNESGLVGYWSFDFRDGRDSSPTLNTASIVGSVGYLPPGAPVGTVAAPTITAVDYDGAAVTVTWTAVGQPGVAGYLLALLDGQGNQIASIPSQDTHASISRNLTSGLYTVQVQASVGGISGPWSTPVPVVASAPPNVSVAVTNNSIAGQWGAVVGATSYRMALYSAGQQISSADVPNTSGSLPAPTDHSRSYTIQVRGLAGAGVISTGPWSSVIPILDAPTMTEVLYDGTQVSAQWQALTAPGVTGYMLAVFDGATQIAQVATSGLQATLPVSLQSNHAYAVQVQATGTQTKGPWSAGVPIIANAPTNLLAGTNGTQVVATWQAISGVDGYSAELNTNGTWGAAQSVTVPTATFPGELTAGSQYQVRVSAYKGISSGPWSPVTPGPFLRNATAEYDGFGHLTRIDFATWSITYTYDALGNITTVTTLVTQ